MIAQISRFYKALHPCVTPNNPKAPNAKSEWNESMSPTVGVCGRLADNIVMIDIDNAEQLTAMEKIIDACGLKVPSQITPHGMHYYFTARSDKFAVHQNYTGVMLACGVRADIKIGAKNGFDCIKEYGQEPRQWRNADAELVQLPAYMFPIAHWDGGDFALHTFANRNNTLFKLMGVLKRNGFDYDFASRIVRMINHCVLVRPLDSSEVSKVTRKDSFEKALGAITINENDTTKAEMPQEKKPSYRDIAEQVMAKFRAIYHAGDSLFINRDGVITRVPNTTAEHAIVMEGLQESTIKQRAEVIAWIKMLSPELKFDAAKTFNFLVPFENGTANINTSQCFPFGTWDFVNGSRYREVFFHRVPHSLPMTEEGLTYVGCCDKDTESFATNEAVDTFFNQLACGDETIVTMIYEMIGACLCSFVPMRGAFVLLGPKANGKSTFLNFVNYVVGPQNCAHVKLQDLAQSYMAAELLGKTANLGDDISDTYIKDVNMIKSMITGDLVTANIKYKDPITFNSVATHIFTANFVPSVLDNTGALYDRFIFVPFNADFSQHPDNSILDKLCTEENAIYVIFKALEHLRLARLKNAYTRSEASIQTWKEHRIENDSTLMFMQECFPDGADSLVGMTARAVYDRYKMFCDQECRKPLGMNKFGRTLRANYPRLETKDVRSSEGVLKTYVLKSTY